MEKVTKEGKEKLAKYASNMEAKLEGNPKGKGWYSYSDNKIYLNIDEANKPSEALGYTKNMVTFLHEAGHWIDYNALGEGKTIHGELKDLRKLIRQDVINKCNENNKGEKYKTMKEVLNYHQGNVIYNLFVDKDLKNGVSDIYEGATKGKIGGWKYGCSGHGVGYWKGDALEKEAIAQFFEAFASGGKKAKYMKEYLPTAFQYFLDFIKKM